MFNSGMARTFSDAILDISIQLGPFDLNKQLFNSSGSGSGSGSSSRPISTKKIIFSILSPFQHTVLFSA